MHNSANKVDDSFQPGDGGSPDFVRLFVRVHNKMKQPAHATTALKGGACRYLRYDADEG